MTKNKTEVADVKVETDDLAEVEDEVREEKEEAIEEDAGYWAGRVVNIIREIGEDVEPERAVEILAILDAEHNITDNFDDAELDQFLDDFEDAVASKLEKETEVKERAEGKK